MKKVFSLMLLLATMIVFSACGGDDEDEPQTLSQTDYEIYAGETVAVKGTGLKDVVWHHSDRFVAEVSGDAVLSAHKVGQAQINTSSIRTPINVTVKPKVTMYSEPLIHTSQKCINGQLVTTQKGAGMYLWGTSTIDSYVKDSGLPWELVSKTSELIVYDTGNTATPLISYMFDEYGRIYGTCIYMNYLYASQLPDFLDERFVIYSVDSSNYTADFAHIHIYDDGSKKINYAGRMALSSSSGMILIVYVGDVNSSRSCVVSDEIMDKFARVIK